MLHLKTQFVMSNKVIVKIDDVIEEEITVSEAKEKARAFNPIKSENVFSEEQHRIIKSVRKAGFHIGFDLEELIGYLQELYKQFGNMPVFYFDDDHNAFRKPELTDIDVVRKYFTIQANTKEQFMNIKNDRALSFFVCSPK